jgi:hypothetical protein
LVHASTAIHEIGLCKPSPSGREFPESRFVHCDPEPELVLGAALRIAGDCGLPLRQFIGGEGRGEVVLRFMGSRDLQNWLHFGTLNRSWLLVLTYELTATVDSLSANLLGERAGERWCSGSWKRQGEGA